MQNQGILLTKNQAVKVVRAGSVTEVYVMEKFDRQGRTRPGFRQNLTRRVDNALRARRMVRWLSTTNAVPGSAYFFTATFADDVRDYDEGLIRWQRFIRKLKREYPRLVYVAVPEVQPRSGRWHFHAILCNLPPQNE